MKIETAVKKVVEFLQSNPASGKDVIGTKTKVKGLELTNVIKRLRKDGTLVEEGEGADLKLSFKAVEAETAPVEETPAPEDEVKTSKGRNNQKFKFNGNEYGKGPLVREVVREYVAGHPKVTLKQLKEIFPDELLKRFGIFQEESVAKTLSGARDRYFFKDEQLIKLSDKKVIAVCNQLTSDNIQPFLKTARALGFKIK